MITILHATVISVTLKQHKRPFKLSQVQQGYAESLQQLLNIVCVAI